MLKLLVLVFLQVKLKKKAKTINSSILIHKNLKKNTETISLAFLQVKLKKKCQN
jgi:hypothetical protein